MLVLTTAAETSVSVIVLGEGGGVRTLQPHCSRKEEEEVR